MSSKFLKENSIFSDFCLKLYNFFPHLGATSDTENDPENITDTDDEIEFFQEIQKKLDHFGFKRHQVEIITDPSKIRKKRIYTEVEYCHKLGKPPMKKSRVIFIEEPALDVPPVETVSNLMIYFLY